MAFIYPGFIDAHNHVVKAAIWSLDPKLTIGNAQTLEGFLEPQIAQRRFNMLLISLFGLLAIVFVKFVLDTTGEYVTSSMLSGKSLIATSIMENQRVVYNGSTAYRTSVREITPWTLSNSHQGAAAALRREQAAPRR